MSVAARPNDIARETLRQLVSRKFAPTPENYRRIYHEIAGKGDDDVNAALERTLTRLAAELPRNTPELVRVSHQFTTAVCGRQWEDACRALTDVMRELATGSKFGQQTSSACDGSGTDATSELRELLAQTLEQGVATRLFDAPAADADARQLVRRLREPTPIPGPMLREQLRALWLTMELHGSQRDRLQAGLLDLLRLLVENIGELVSDDEWLRGQMSLVMQVISGPLEPGMIAEARRSLREVIFRRGLLKQSLVEAKLAIKQMASSFVEQIGTMALATGEYHDKIESLSTQISQTEDIATLTRLLDEVMRETRRAQESALRSREEILQARSRVEAAENKIRELEHEIENLSEKTREDHLTGTMNRRGMNDAFEREIAISDRAQRPLSVALLDIDNFKALNDTFGHQAGDNALVHLSRVIRQTVRPGDIVARFGGEEFLILLPNSDSDEAVTVVSRLQRELTRCFFLHDNRKVLITFSAGVARRAPGEAQTEVIARADEALYQAKRAGKNRVIAAPDIGFGAGS